MKYYFERQIKNIREIVDSSIALNKVLPIGLIIFLAAYYLPAMPVFSEFISGETLSLVWDKIYSIIDPVIVMPWLMGILSIFVIMGYRKIWFKILFFLFYAVSLMFSLLAVMVMKDANDLLIYLPDVLFIAIDITLEMRIKNCC